MWGGQQQQQQAGGGMAGMYGGGVGGGMGGGGSQSQQAQKHDIFVGNLSFNTTEDQLHQAFSEIGRVINVRMVTDQETGKPRGFAFVEFEDPQVALSAIRNMNDYELNGRRLRVNFSNSSHLEALAGKLGMDLSQQTGKQTSGAHNNRSGNNSGSNLGSTNLTGAGAVAGTNAVADALKSFSKGEMYDVIAKLKEIADRDPDEARRVISGHPQLPEALLFLMSKLDMVKTPIEMASMPMAVPVAPAVPIAAPPVRAADPRAAGRVDPRQQQPPKLTQPAAAPPRMDPRQQQQQQAPPVRSDPRADPRAAARANAGGLPPPPPPRLAPPPPPPASTGAPPPPPPPPQGNVANLDPGLVQQVMSLTPQQIAGLPPDQQQSILQLRQQITGKWG